VNIEHLTASTDGNLPVLVRLV